MRDGGAAVFAGRGHQVLGDQRPRDGRHQRVAIHVQRVAGDGGQAVLLGELVTCVDHHRLHRPTVEGSLADHLHVLATLAEVDGHGHHLLTGFLTDPADGHRGVQAAGIREDHALRHEGVTPCSSVVRCRS